MPKSKELKKAIKITKKINKFLYSKFDSSGKIEIKNKKNDEIVTHADTLANEIILKKLKKYFPHDNIISEEAPKIKNGGKRTWYVDPLDGTTNFAYGFKEFTTHIGFTKNNKIKCGAIGSPLTNEIFWAEKDQGAFVNGKKIIVAEEQKHNRLMALICGGHTPKGQKELNKIFEKLNNLKAHIRIFAAAGVELTHIACSKADVCIMTDVHPWDVIPGVIIVREAGGKVTNFQGEDWKIDDTNIVATNGKIHSKIISLLREL